MINPCRDEVGKNVMKPPPVEQNLERIEKNITYYRGLISKLSAFDEQYFFPSNREDRVIKINFGDYLDATLFSKKIWFELKLAVRSMSYLHDESLD